MNDECRLTIDPPQTEWNRFAQSFYKIDRIHYFDTCPPEEDSTFIIRHSIFAFSKFLFRFDRTFVWPAVALTPETFRNLQHVVR